MEREREREKPNSANNITLNFTISLFRFIIIYNAESANLYIN